MLDEPQPDNQSPGPRELTPNGPVPLSTEPQATEIQATEPQATEIDHPEYPANAPVPDTTSPTKVPPNRPLQALWIAILTSVLFYVFLLPEIQIVWWKYHSPNRMLPSALQLDLLTRSVLRLLEAFVIAFFFAVGASFGSFLNVVAYRLPNHLDISVAGSRCPKCQKRLTFKENMPIFGWISLRGQCSGCQVAIPFKYLAAELLLGFIAVWLGAYELLSGGINLPLRTPNYYAGVVWIVFYTKWDLVSYALFHFTLFCILSTQILILDNNLRVPKRFIAFSLLLGITLSLAFPWLHLMHSSILLPGIEIRAPGQLEGVLPQWLYSNLQSVAVGMVYSGIVAIIAATIALGLSRRDKSQNFLLWLGTFGYLGIWLGWQAALLIAVISLSSAALIFAIHLLKKVFDVMHERPAPVSANPRRALQLMTIILAATAIHHSFWKAIVNTLLHVLS